MKPSRIRHPGETLISLFRLINIRLAVTSQGGVHTEDSHAAVNNFHSVKSGDIGDGSASAHVDFAQFRSLEGYIVIVKDFSYSCHISALASLDPDFPLAPVYLFRTIPLPR